MKHTYPESKYDYCPNDYKAMDWFYDNGFDFKVKRQNYASTVFIIKKDGIVDEFKVPTSPKIKVKEYLTHTCLENHRLTLEINKLLASKRS